MASAINATPHYNNSLFVRA